MSDFCFIRWLLFNSYYTVFGIDTPHRKRYNIDKEKELIYMKYEIKYACGHTGTVQLFGKTADRERKVKWLETQICPDCEHAETEKRRAEEAKAAEEKAEEFGLPELEGTPKQVSWALTIRDNIIKRELDTLKRKQRRNSEAAEKQRHFIDWLCQQNQASFWIDHRRHYSDELQYFWKQDQQKKEEEKMLLGNDENAEIIAPEEKTTNTIAHIKEHIGSIEVNSEKDDRVIGCVKKCGFKWRGNTWSLEIIEKTGTADDRMAEVGNLLLNAGVSIEIKKSLKEKAVHGDFKAKSYKWIDAQNGEIYITWHRDASYYNEAKRLPGAKWVSGRGMAVKPEYFEEIQEFVNLYQFSVTKKAQALLKEAEDKIKGVPRVSPVTVKESIDNSKPNLQDILKSSRDILDDLRDD